MELTIACKVTTGGLMFVLLCLWVRYFSGYSGCRRNALCKQECGDRATTVGLGSR